MARLALMKPLPLTFRPAGLATMISERWPAISRKPLIWLGFWLLTSSRITCASPVASQGLPWTQPPICVGVLVRLLLTTAPRLSTSICERRLRETPAALGVVMLSCGRPLPVVSTVGRWLPGALLSLRIWA